MITSTKSILSASFPQYIPSLFQWEKEEDGYKRNFSGNLPFFLSAQAFQFAIYHI